MMERYIVLDMNDSYRILNADTQRQIVPMMPTSRGLRVSPRSRYVEVVVDIDSRSPISM